MKVSRAPPAKDASAETIEEGTKPHNADEEKKPKRRQSRARVEVWTKARNEPVARTKPAADDARDSASEKSWEEASDEASGEARNGAGDEA